MTKCGFVAIIGKPNSGKSTLLNTILGEDLSIVTPKPQTTRKNVLGIYSCENIQIIFTDTPGILKPRYELQRSMMGYVAETLEATDLVLVIVDAEKFTEIGRYFHSEVVESLRSCGKKLICVLNKTDLFIDKKELLPKISDLAKSNLFSEIIPISALKADSITTLIECITKNIPESEFHYDDEYLSNQSERFFVAELIRKSIFTLFEDELPYSTEVVIIAFKEREHGKWYISADIVIDKNSQKRILIGEKGNKIRLLGAQAREEIEKHLAKPVYLELFVKVRNNWRNDKAMLRSFGY